MHAHTKRPQDLVAGSKRYKDTFSEGPRATRVHSEGYSKHQQVGLAHSEHPRAATPGFTGRLVVSYSLVIFTNT
jgi:hypothetical protein